jgi:DUF971 family protein
MKPIPREIKASEGNIRIRWSDEHQSEYVARDLRLACRCAGCVDEWTHERTVQESHVPTSLQPKGIDVVGNYALHFTWSDGHSTGIYTYDYLRDVCACADCRRKRSFDV